MPHDQLRSAYRQARQDLLERRGEQNHWTGVLATSALSTATAVSALSEVRRNATTLTESSRSELDNLVHRGVAWLVTHQHADGGWGDTQKSYSNIATTMLAVAALHLAGAQQEHRSAIQRGSQYIQAKGGTQALRARYGKDKTFAVPILTNCALAGLASWNEIAPLPFEAACVPQRWYRFAQMPVVSYAIPALVAIGQAHYLHRTPRNPLVRLIRSWAIRPSLKVLLRMQPQSGGYLEAIPLTSFVVMALAGTGRGEHPVAQNGVRFLQMTVRDDGSWPIDTNLATWNTTLSLVALAGAGENVAELDCLDWLLRCQHLQRHPFTGAEPGGWGWSDLSGAVPDADDTPGALLALADIYDSASCPAEQRARIHTAVDHGIRWLLRLQNRDGGWPTFCRGWGKLPFDRSGADLTAHAIRALTRWRTELKSHGQDRRISRAISRGFRYLDRQQAPDGSWTPLWFGNQDHPLELNPVYGTAKVLLAYSQCARGETSAAYRGFMYLAGCQNADGGWGGGPALEQCEWDPRLGDSDAPCSADDQVALESGTAPPKVRSARSEAQVSMTPVPEGHPSSIEETALALEALLDVSEDSQSAGPAMQLSINKGLEWLCRRVDGGGHHESSPIGFYFAKLWYHERLYPLIFTVSALGKAVRLNYSDSNR